MLLGLGWKINGLVWKSPCVIVLDFSVLIFGFDFVSLDFGFLATVWLSSASKICGKRGSGRHPCWADTLVGQTRLPVSLQGGETTLGAPHVMNFACLWILDFGFGISDFGFGSNLFFFWQLCFV